MNLSNLLEKAEAAPQAPSKINRKWTNYKPVFVALLDKGYSKRGAAHWISKEEGLSKEDCQKLYQSAKQWRQI